MVWFNEIAMPQKNASREKLSSGRFRKFLSVRGGHLAHGVEKRVRLLRLADHDVVLLAETARELGRDVVLEAVALDRFDDGRGAVLRRHERTLVKGALVVGNVPDLGPDGPGQGEAHLDAGAVQVDRHALAPPAQRELRGAVGGLVGDAET